MMAMARKEYPLSQKEFDAIYAKVPRLTVEVILKNDAGAIFMTKRAMSTGITAACYGKWCLPSGTVQFGETLQQAVARVARREVGAHVKKAELRGYIDYPSHFEHGMDCVVGIVFEVLDYSRTIRINAEASDSGWFTVLPKAAHPDEDDFLVGYGYLKRPF